MKKSTVMKLIVSLLCVTMFTACGKRNSKKRKTGVYTGPTATSTTDTRKKGEPTPIEEDQTRNGDEENDESSGTGNDGEDIVIIPGTLDPDADDNSDTTADNNDDDRDDDQRDRTRTNDRDIVIRDSSRPSNTSNSPRTSGNLTNERVSNDTPRQDPLSGLKFYADTPFKNQISVPDESETLLRTDQNYKFADIVHDKVVYSLVNLFDSDIANSVNDKFEEQSKELSEAINSIYSTVNVGKQSINVNFQIGKKGDVFENNVLNFYGQLTDEQTARLTPTEQSSNFDYILDVVCLDKKATHCQQQQLVLSYFYKKDAEDGSYKKGDLCKRAYAVNRTGHASLNMHSNMIEFYVLSPDKLSQVCNTSAVNDVRNAVTCATEFVYNTLDMKRNNSCLTQPSTRGLPLCALELAPPETRYAENIHLHTFSVAYGKSQFLFSVHGDDDRYFSLEGMLVDTNRAVEVEYNGLRVDGVLRPRSYLTNHISSVHLNGMDGQGVMQFKISYDGIKDLPDGENLQSEITIDVIPRFPEVSLGLFQTRFEDPTEDEITDIKTVTEGVKDDGFSLKKWFKNATKDKTKKVKSSDYTCEGLKSLIIEEKKVHVYGKVWKANSSHMVNSKESACNKRHLGDEQQPAVSNFVTSDKTNCHIGFHCVFKSSN